MAMITDADDFFTKGCGRCERFATPECSTRWCVDGLKQLRAICLDEGLVEEVKWAHPCYMHAGRNICLFGAFREDFRLSFFNAALLTDKGDLRPNGPNAAEPSVLFFTAVSQVAEQEDFIRKSIRELKDHAEKGTKPPKVEREIDVPDELVDAMDADPELAEAFEALTPGRQKSYLFALNSAKQSQTRVNRIEKFRPMILAGKGALER